MHGHHAGLGGKHILPKVQAYVKELGQQASKIVDDQYVLFILVHRLSNHLLFLEWTVFLTGVGSTTSVM